MAKAEVNGRRKMPKETIILDFGSDGFEGFYTEAWVDMPLGFFRRMQRWQRSKNKDAKEAVELFLHVFPEWDFNDYDGKPIPHTATGMQIIPERLIDLMWAKRAKAISERAMPPPLKGSGSKPPSERRKASTPLTS